MRKLIRHRYWFAAALCAVFSLVLGAAIARAAGEGNTLTVALSANDDAYVEDLRTADVVVDVYKLADPDGGSFSAAEGFTALADELAAALGGEGDWAAVAEHALAAAQAADAPEPVATGASIDEGVSLADDALYLVLARGADEPVGSAEAYSATYKYAFQASIIALPAEDEAVCNLKSSRAPLFGSLVIRKSVTESVGSEPSTFVFHIVGEGYDNYAAITWPDQTSTTVTHIPAGITVTVTEEYEGARYYCVSGNGSQALIVSDHAVEAGAQVAGVDFVNAPDGDHPGGGHGIENHFEYDETGDWPVSATPAAKLVEE